MDTVYLYDIFHVRHVLCVDGFDVGETVINTDNRNPVIQYGSAPIDLLPYWGHWFTLAQAEHDLVSIGFKKIDKTMWIRGGYEKQNVVSSIWRQDYQDSNEKR